MREREFKRSTVLRAGQGLVGLAMTLLAAYGGYEGITTSMELDQKKQDRAALIAETPNPSEPEYIRAQNYLATNILPLPRSTDNYEEKDESPQLFTSEQAAQIDTARTTVIRRGQFENIPDPVNTRPAGLVALATISALLGSVGPVVVGNAMRAPIDGTSYSQQQPRIAA